MRKRITILLGILSLGIVLLFMALNGYLQVEKTEDDTIFAAEILFNQVENVISRNNEEIRQTKEEHSANCVSRARAAAYVLQQNPSAITDTAEMKRIARLLDVDELHIFDRDGRIYAGSEPKYFGYSMDSGEQIGFFTPMLSDTSLEMCQPITPNTAEGKPMQYAAVWMEDRSAIVEIGMEPRRLLDRIRENELSNVFLLFTVDKGSSLFAVDPETYTISGSSKEYMLGKDVRNWGMDPADLEDSTSIFHYTIEGHSVYCMFKQTDSVILGRMLSEENMYKGVRSANVRLLGGMLLITLGIMCFILYYLNKSVIRPVETINSKLGQIAEGNFSIKIEEDSSPEFSDLSAHINVMVKNILEITDVVSGLVETSDLAIGIYDYHSGLDRVRVTGRVAEILHMTQEEMEELTGDFGRFNQRMQQLFRNPYSQEKNIYLLKQGDKQYYIRVERVDRKGGTFGILSDYTESILEKQSLQKKLERDMVTDLYSRNMLEDELDRLFEDPARLQCGALVVIDSDDLKKANDTYGHENGDRYLRATADTLVSLNAPEQITARIGGDEFVIYLGGLRTQEEVEEHIERLRRLRDRFVAHTTEGVELPIRYSLGVGYFPADGDDWHALLKCADERMYLDKRQRKGDDPR